MKNTDVWLTAIEKTRNGGNPEQFIEAQQERDEMGAKYSWECPHCKKWQVLTYNQKWVKVKDNRTGEMKDHLKKIPIWECKYCKY